MESRRPNLDYPAAAEQLLAVLAQVATKGPGARGQGTASLIPHPSPLTPRSVPAAVLCRLIFPIEFRHWTHETRRRRVRDTVVVARKLLAAQSAVSGNGSIAGQISADGAGYWLSADPATLAAYMYRRRRQGLAHLAAVAHQIKPPLASIGQPSLYPAAAEHPELVEGSQHPEPVEGLFPPPPPDPLQSQFAH